MNLALHFAVWPFWDKQLLVETSRNSRVIFGDMYISRVRSEHCNWSTEKNVYSTNYSYLSKEQSGSQKLQHGGAPLAPRSGENSARKEQSPRYFFMKSKFKVS